TEMCYCPYYTKKRVDFVYTLKQTLLGLFFISALSYCLAAFLLIIAAALALKNNGKILVMNFGSCT
ncbi:hypothetical protein, partial [Bacillus altitudinis]|uniref:hypothetical protein n=1 Tax=Bacillus altitudinis TaxID=293387 RepID=UPI001C92FC68